MIRFDPNDPFPLLPASQRSYAAEKDHAKHVDGWLGLNIDRVEAELREKTAKEKNADVTEEMWIGLDPQALLTPYTELREAMEYLQPKNGSHVVDLGAGYGRLAHVLARHFPHVHFTGYEIVRERCEEATRVMREKLGSATSVERELECADLAAHAFAPVMADTFFIYDFGSKASVEKCMHDLQAIALRKPIAVVGRGRLARHLIESQNPWLSQTVAPQHFDRYSIYRSR